MNYLQSNNNRYRHHFCIFAKYRINMKREILYQRIAGTIAWQTDTLFYILTGTDIRINQHLRTGNEIKRGTDDLVTRNIFDFLVILFHSDLLHPLVDSYKSFV